jgi:hypothetical protein
MKPELKAKVLAYNKRVKAQVEKATDMDIMIAAISKLPPGQPKKVLSDEAKEVLRKYGVNI